MLVRHHHYPQVQITWCVLSCEPELCINFFPTSTLELPIVVPFPSLVHMQIIGTYMVVPMKLKGRKITETQIVVPMKSCNVVTLHFSHTPSTN